MAPFDTKDEDRRLTPQQKKAYSYAQDGRNTYGEDAKSSRKNIPLRKRLVNKANRHADRQLLSEATGAADPDTAEAAEQRAQGRRPKRWRKVPDQRLARTSPVVVRTAMARYALGLAHSSCSRACRATLNTLICRPAR